MLFCIKYFFLMGAAIVMIAASAFWRPVAPPEQRFFIEPPQYIEYFTFGYGEVIADGMWIRAIQDFDFCEQEVAKQTCKSRGWVYHMLDTITDLSPKNLVAFRIGPVNLSIIVNDQEGASKLFDKAVEHFPNDWTLLYRASYQALYEEKDKKKAANLLIRAAKNGGAPWFYDLAARLYSDSDNKALGISLYQSLKASGEDEKVLARMREKLGIKDDSATQTSDASSVPAEHSAH